MPVIVVLSDCPPKLRGDMTKWFFEINTGVYVGNVSARVRENLWKRITENIGRGHVTMVYNAPGEQRMDFRVHNAYWEPVDFDGIKLMRRPEHKSTSASQNIRETAFSNAAKHRIAAASTKKTNEYSSFQAASYVVLDFETTGLEAKKDEIIEIGAILVDRGRAKERMQTLVRCSGELPSEITRLTGITGRDLEKMGVTQEDAVKKLLEFAEDLPFVCHNATFEQMFFLEVCSNIAAEPENRFIDTLKMAQRLLPNMDNYKLSTLASYFGISYPTQHRALADCEATYGIYTKLINLILSETQKNEQ